VHEKERTAMDLDIIPVFYPFIRNTDKIMFVAMPNKMDRKLTYFVKYHFTMNHL
jgi:hypothetical protein